MVIGCLGGGIKQLKEDIRDLPKEQEDQMQKTVQWESKSIVWKVLLELIKWIFWLYSYKTF